MRTPPGKGDVADQNTRQINDAVYTATARDFQPARDLRCQAEDRRRLQELADQLPELSPVEDLILNLLWQIQADLTELRRGRP